MTRSFGVRTLAALLLALLGCSLVVDTGNLDCPDDHKVCGDSCVRKDDPAFGCSDTHCESCPFRHGVTSCEAGACTISECLDGWGCNNCETNLNTDELHCGACDAPCLSDTQICSAGVCVERSALSSG